MDARTMAQRDPRRTGTRRRRLMVTVVAAVSSFAVLSVAASAASGFSDVPASHPFKAQIDWMNETGITTGYPDGTFRPGEAVSRQSMAVFMQRLFNVRDAIGVDSTSAASAITSTTYTSVAGAAATVTVPPGTTATLVAELTGETTCSGSTMPGFCHVRLLVNGAEMAPTHTEGSHYAIDSNDHGTEGANSTEGHTMTRHHGPVGPGTYTVTVEGGVNTTGTTFVLADWVLTARTILEPAP